LAWAAWPCHDSPTYPPSGTFNDAALKEEYVHFSDLPSDHHRDQ
jgi:hypothetical protein